MAGDWIKMRGELFSHPKFLTLCNLLIYEPDDPGLLWYACGTDAMSPALPPRNESVTDRALQGITEAALRDVTLAALLRVWCAVNSHCKLSGDDAVMTPMTQHDLDDIAGFSGFGACLLAVGWVKIHESNSLLFPNFREFNEPACVRGPAKTNAQRQRDFRERVAARSASKPAPKPSRNESNESNGREEKRREEKSKDLRSSSEIRCANSEAEEPRATARTPEAEPEGTLVVFATVAGRASSAKTWGLTAKHAAELSEAFPDLDVIAEARKALLWTQARTGHRKTAAGMPKFLLGWMSRANDAGPSRRRHPAEGVPAPHGNGHAPRPTLNDRLAVLNFPDTPTPKGEP